MHVHVSSSTCINADACEAWTGVVFELVLTFIWNGVVCSCKVCFYEAAFLYLQACCFLKGVQSLRNTFFCPGWLYCFNLLLESYGLTVSELLCFQGISLPSFTLRSDESSYLDLRPGDVRAKHHVNFVADDSMWNQVVSSEDNKIIVASMSSYLSCIFGYDGQPLLSKLCFSDVL